MSAPKILHPGKAAAMLTLATLIWGASFLAMKALGQKQQDLVQSAGTWYVAALSLLIRFGVAALVMGIWCGRKLRHITPLEFWQGAGLGFFGGVGTLFQMDGVQYIAASTSAFLTQCYCILIPIMLALRYRKLPGKMLMAGCLMALAGVAILSNIDLKTFRLGRGELESILGSVLFTGQILWLERPVFHANRNSVVTFIMFAVVGLLMLGVVGSTGSTPRQWIAAYASGPALGLIAFLALVGTLATYVIMNYWQPHLPATQAGVIYCSEPLFTSLFALFVPGLLSSAFRIHYPNEALTAQLFFGGGLITAANLLAMRAIVNPPPSLPRSATNRAA
jgi:drug/metabolite transporter (DMT)-like permease